MPSEPKTTADSMITYMRSHNPPRDVYRAKHGGYFMTHPGNAAPRPQASLDMINEALRRGLIRLKYPNTEGYWELCE